MGSDSLVFLVPVVAIVGWAVLAVVSMATRSRVRSSRCASGLYPNFRVGGFLLVLGIGFLVNSLLVERISPEPPHSD